MQHIFNFPALKLAFIIPPIFWSLQKASSQEYFQQEVNYTINVTLNDKKHVLDGFESVVYINNSPDTLSFLYFHLWPNGYSSNKTALARDIFSRDGKSKLFNDPELKGYIDSLDFMVDGLRVNWNPLPDTVDICRINLYAPLRPGDTIHISTPFHVKIPKGVTSRLGHIGQSYQISQWYPKPAVYDNSGWHQMPYLDQGEFYSEYGSFDVSITLPDNYIVGATGNLQNEQEIKRLDMLARDVSWIKTINAVSTTFPPSSDQMKTLRYTEENIHDFAWFADKRYHVTKGKVKLPRSGREITTWAMFTDKEALYWLSAISYINNAITDYSNWIGDYPYNNFTAVQGPITAGSGMEYPELTVIGSVNDPYELDDVLAHEVCHSWFYSALGNNERRFPFMDESIVSAYESRYLEEKYPDEKLWEIVFKNIKLARLFNITQMPAQRLQELTWLIPARKNQDQPVNLAAMDYSNESYVSVIYSKGAQGFNYLRSYLGNPGFDSVMHNYFLTWKNKHPQPQDLSKVFEAGNPKDLSWFFDDFLGTTMHLYYKTAGFKNGKLLVKNKGKLDSPLLLTGFSGDSLTSEHWVDGFKGKRSFNTGWENDSEIKIDPDHRMTELFRLNSNIRTSGIFRKANPFQFQFLYTIEDPGKRTLIYFPAFNWTRADGFMAGAALTNGSLLPKPVEYSFFPFYAFRNPEINGYGKISFNIIPYNALIRLASFSLEGTRFAAPGDQNYNKLKVGLDLNFRPHNTVSHKVFGYYITASDLGQVEMLKPAKMLSFLELGYTAEKSVMVNPFNFKVSFEAGAAFQKTSLEFNYKYSYYSKKNGLEMRLFAGTMINYSTSYPFYNFAVSGRSGREEYLYEGFYPDRFTPFPETFWSREMTISEGGLVSPVNDTLNFSRWLCSLSITSSLPEFVSWLPVKPFLNIALNDHGTTANRSAIFFEAGLKAGIWNFIEIYVSLLVSDNINSITRSFRDRIRFIFNLDFVNPSKVNLILPE